MSTRVITKEAGDVLAYGLARPRLALVCGDCNGGESRRLGWFHRKAQLVFFLKDRTVGLWWASTDTAHARIRAVSATEWKIWWDDSGGCTPACPDGDFNDLVTKVVLRKTH